jgi:integrase
MTSNKTQTQKIDVTTSESLQDFCDDRELSDRSRYLYQYYLNMYCNYLNKDLEELLDEADKEENARVKPRKRKINKYLRNFKKYLESQEYGTRTVNQAIIYVKAFYNHYDIDIPKAKNKRSRKARLRNSKNVEDIESIPTLDELKRVIELSNDLYKFIAVLGISSGMGQAEIGSLTYNHVFKAFDLERKPKTMKELIEKIEDKGEFIPTWYITRVKTGKNYFTFSSPQSVQYLLIYLKEYHRKYPEFNPKPEDVLIRSLKYGKPVNESGASKYFSELSKYHNLRKYNNRFVCTCHGFRKYFATTLEEHKVPHLTIRRLMGHKVDDLTNAYFKIAVEHAKQDYIDAVNELATDKVIYKQINIYDDITEKYKELEGKYNELAKILVIESGKIEDLVPEEFVDVVKEEIKRQNYEEDQMNKERWNKLKESKLK